MGWLRGWWGGVVERMVEWGGVEWMVEWGSSEEGGVGD